MQPCHIGPGPRFYRLFLDAGRELLPKWPWSVWIRSWSVHLLHCCTQHCQWCMHCTASAGIWTRLNLTDDERYKKKVRSLIIYIDSVKWDQSLCVLLSLSGSKWKMRAFELNNTPTTDVATNTCTWTCSSLWLGTSVADIVYKSSSASGPTLQWYIFFLKIA
jgi:hypothetical protein